jgi:hypothetical protein
LKLASPILKPMPRATIADGPHLFELLRTIRSRRIGCGYRVDAGGDERHPVTGRILHQASGPRRFVSALPPTPLSTEEEALLAWAACGPNGLIAWEASIGGGFEQLLRLVGRTAPEANNVRATDLVVVNDDGAFLYRPTPAITNPVLLPADPDAFLQHLVNWYQDGRTRLADGRPDLDWAQREPAAPHAMLNGSHQYNLNRSGSTWLIPVTDAGALQSGLVDLIFRQRTGLCDDLGGAGIPVFDTLHRDGAVERLIGLGDYERSVLLNSAYPAGAIVQNVRLASESLGLGAWCLSGYYAELVFGLRPDLTPGLGFADGARDDVFPLTRAPSPRYPTGRAVVDDWYARRHGEQGWSGPAAQVLSGPESPYRPEIGRALAEHPDVVPPDWAWDAAAAHINWCIARHGRWPVTYAPLLAGFSVIVHHLDTAYYDRHYRDGLITDRIRQHEERWH